MKQVYIILRPNRYYETKDALIENNFFSLSSKDVLGRGKSSVDYVAKNGSELPQYSKHSFVAKKLIEIFCRDEDVEKLINIVKRVNQTGNSGDGKIFVINVEDGTRIRTGESGINSLM
ncbi:P-II family nitrogen regulator [Clostridium tyrobutyricum]|jgi:nitrogen regulatory protein PII 2|uniref:Nitrogen regulatory protein P-II n=1 Tax=Clostridium tyrobutyricum DIVETGP TaxID=1408889 RepID=W6N8Z2_CLOTY|nr:P-II family nitrogen regulator [Clostridium tyrobutyricum]AND85348.1 nitrogen regulatory protein PII [Clostridium tyrobutyricum]ANP69899.1 transcriptional regulator [Clostridium tyrobutyricum]MBV4416515.1 P-II family nitrogen regulator [Clostridium tyrobutyricum]MBV4429218.1 P-II family nitrogen regulator [Clostridium tyrobutyricum]MBV4434276.1 P-II family nitrogen regulator [Clostridium tyrobutyricum]